MRLSKSQQDFLTKWVDSTGGNEYGEPMYCGFAWVTVYPEHKGNTRAGKQERAVLESMGFRKDWTGKAYQLWNPGGHAGQSMDVKEHGGTCICRSATATWLQSIHGIKSRLTPNN